MLIDKNKSFNCPFTIEYFYKLYRRTFVVIIALDIHE